MFLALNNLESAGKRDKTNQSINSDCVVIISTIKRQVKKKHVSKTLPLEHGATAFEEKYAQQPILLK